ncbi:MAG: hypothetical protein JSW05_10560 [Candidatus Thorarchaeota archaeon]|nr:MAG: hypothetical protein JSW05_10560 [Candidatus Thorarchaeota archaeon]
MSEWIKVLKANPLKWLAGEDNPSVRYHTLIHLLDRPPTHRDVLDIRSTIASNPKVARILSKQSSKGHWESPTEPYRSKYKSSYWQIMILGMLGVDRTIPEAEKAVEHVFQFQHEEGGFAKYGEDGARRDYKYRRKKALEREQEPPHERQWIHERVHETQFTCLTGNICLALTRLGYSSDKRVKKALKWLVKVQNEDGGWLCPYWSSHKNDKHGCFMGTIAPLDAFSELPVSSRPSAMTKSIEAGVEFLLMHRLFKADHHGFKIIKESWLKLGFPQFFYDILRGLSVVCKLGYADDERIDDALKVLLDKQLADGRWLLESSPIGRMQTNLEQKGEPSKWITLEALRVVKSVYQSRGVLKLS